jgi:hypothetical protein
VTASFFLLAGSDVDHGGRKLIPTLRQLYSQSLRQ